MTGELQPINQGAPIELPFDWRNPDYVTVFKQRAERLARLRSDPDMLASVRLYYRTHIDDFINDWGVTVDPRVASKGRSPIMPMILWPKQRDYIRFLFQNWKDSEPGTCVKSRDVGISWLAMGFAVGMCVFYDDWSAGFGSEKEDKVDRSGDPDCLFYKGRMFIQYLPSEFRGGWDVKKNSAHMRLTFPHTGSSITGEAGDNIGRGGRKSVYLVDESAHIPNPKAIDASLSATTDCRQDMSSVNGMANSFAERAHNPNIRRFDFSYTDDPRKDKEWERKKRAELDPMIFEQEYGCNFSAGVQGVVIPPQWVALSVDAHLLFNLKPRGVREGALDVADTGTDLNAFGVRHDFLVVDLESWRGSIDLDTHHSAERSFLLTDLHGLDGFLYDADGLGSGIRGNARKINEHRAANNAPTRFVRGWRASGEVFAPTLKVRGTERTAEDFFENAKAQAWWDLRGRFQYTAHLVERHNAGEVIRPEDIDLSLFISLSSKIKELQRTKIELSQPVWAESKRGKVMVDKCPVGTPTEVRRATKSPNNGDVVMMLFAPRQTAIVINPALLQATSATHGPQSRF